VKTEKGKENINNPPLLKKRRGKDINTTCMCKQRKTKQKEGTSYAFLATFIRLARRDVLRAAVFQCSVPQAAPLASADSALCNAVLAAVASPETAATSASFARERIVERRERFISLRPTVCRARFFADL
jgi:hypothetical protein